MKISEQEFVQLRKLLCRVSGIDIPANKKYLFETRLSSFLIEKGYKCFSEFYHVIISGSRNELERDFVQSMTTHESGFFRDSHPFQLLENRLLPEIAARRQAEAMFMPAQIRILSAGCSHGQEPYSIAMCVDKWRKAQPEGSHIPKVTIIATDISQKVLKLARQGRFSKLELGSHLPESLKKEYFAYRKKKWEIAEPIKQMVSFSELNLAGPLDSLGKFDIIFCRNVIIYFPQELKQKIFTGFHRALNSGGAVILGASENLHNLQVAFESRFEGKTLYFVPRY